MPFLRELVAAAGPAVLDLHRDEDHNRSVITLAGAEVEEATWRLAVRAAKLGDVAGHEGVHPWLGLLDVVPFVPLAGSDMADALAARDRTAARLAGGLGIPVFLYGPERSLPEIRRRAFRDLWPDLGPGVPSPRLGASCVGARGVLVAYNVVVDASLEEARAIAREVRGPAVRALGLAAGRRIQVSCNLVDPAAVGPSELVESIAHHARVLACELVGLVPGWVLEAIPSERWAALDLDPDRTIEARLARGGIQAEEVR